MILIDKNECALFPMSIYSIIKEKEIYSFI